MDKLKVAIAAYLARSSEVGAAPLARKLSEARSEWPYDVGDDPAFFSARKLDGPVAWGVCRRPVRNNLSVGDLVAFFAAVGKPAAEYRFVGALTVDKLLNAEEVFSESSSFKEYLNLLVCPKGEGWEHYEPVSAPEKWHSDWLWRICERRGYKKDAFKQAGASHQPGDPLLVQDEPVALARNYVVFSTDPRETLVVEDPPLVAIRRKGQRLEEWLETPVAKAVRSLTLGYAKRSHLRTRNRQNPHNHTWAYVPMDRGDWIQELRLATLST